MSIYGSPSFINSTAVFFGVAAAMVMIFGSYIGEYVVRDYIPNRTYSQTRFDIALVFLLGTSIAAHVILMGLILVDYSTVLEALNGVRGAAYRLKANMTKIVGVTSFTQTFMLALPLFAVYERVFDVKPSRMIRILSYVLFGLIFLRAFFVNERFALIEAAVAYFVTFITFRNKRFTGISLFPVAGAVALYVIFAAGEFMRSWAYYESVYDSFWQYVNLRLLGYIATATNNGAGVYENFGGGWGAYLTAAWIGRLPIWDFFGAGSSEGSPIGQYLNRYGNPEFNNPSGYLAGLIDYGPVFVHFYYLLVGVIGGVLYGLFRRGSIFGILYYPGWYVGYLLLTQAIYWGDPRFFTVTILAPLVAFFLVGGSRGPVRERRRMQPQAEEGLNR